MSIKAEIKGKKLCLEVDLETPTPSASGWISPRASSRRG